MKPGAMAIRIDEQLREWRQLKACVSGWRLALLHG